MGAVDVQAFEMLARGEGGAAASEGARVGTAQPYDERTPTLRDPLFQLCCNDASIAI